LYATAANELDRLELLLFGLGGEQRFAINVLKVKEVIPCPHLNQLPDANDAVMGVMTLRGQTITVIDLGKAIRAKSQSMSGKAMTEGSVIVTEFNRMSTAFWVADIDRINVVDWKDVQRPSRGTTHAIYTTGVTRAGAKLVQILDVEKVLGETVILEPDFSTSLTADEIPEYARNGQVLVVDDSSLARRHVANVLEQLGLNYILTHDGKEAMELLQAWIDEGVSVRQHVPLIVSDIEMPEMDGYSLTRTLRQTPAMDGVGIVLHTSLTGAINPEVARSVGADTALTKFDADDLAQAIVEVLSSVAK
jgi:two-component system chemotaxis response regulator CheV